MDLAKSKDPVDRSANQTLSAMYAREDDYLQRSKFTGLRRSVWLLWIGLSLALVLALVDLSIAAALVVTGDPRVGGTLPDWFFWLFYLVVPLTCLVVLTSSIEGMRRAHSGVRTRLTWKLGTLSLTPARILLLLAFTYAVAFAVAIGADALRGSLEVSWRTALYAPSAIVERLFGFCLVTMAALALEPLSEGAEVQGTVFARAGVLVWLALWIVLLAASPGLVAYPWDSWIVMAADASASIALTTLFGIAIRARGRAGIVRA